MSPEDRCELGELRDRIDALRVDLRSAQDSKAVGSTVKSAAGHLDVAWRVLDNALERARPPERRSLPGQISAANQGGAGPEVAENPWGAVGAPDPGIED